METERLLPKLDQLSPYHQDKLVNARSHLLSGNVSDAALPDDLRVKLESIWDKPLVYCSSRHAKLDPLSQCTVGNLLLTLLAESVTPKAQVDNVIWESHPRGMGTVYLTCHSDKGFDMQYLGEDVPNFTPWRKVRSVEEDLYQRLCQQNWHNLAAKMQGMQKVALNSIEAIYSQYEQTLAKSKNDTLTGFSYKIERALASQVYGANLQEDLIQPEPYSSSNLKQKIILTLKALDEEFGLEKVFQTTTDERSCNNLFVGGTDNKLIRVGFSRKKGRFQVSEYGTYPPYPRIMDRKPFDKESIYRLLSENEIIPAGLPAFISLLIASAVTTVAHLGNEYGGGNPLIQGLKAFGLKNGDGYLQITQDNKDCWPIVRFLNESVEQQPRITLSTLMLWKSLYNIDISELVIHSAKLGHPVEMKRIENL